MECGAVLVGCHALGRHSDVTELKVCENEASKLNLRLKKVLHEL